MATVYSSILKFESTNPTFQFHQKGSNVIGLLCAKKWRDQGGRMKQLDVVQSVERFGTHMVYDYPNSFIEDIDEVVKEYVKIVIGMGRKKDTSGKPAHPQKQQKQNQSGPSSSPQRKRKRIPIAKPAFTGAQFRR